MLVDVRVCLRSRWRCRSTRRLVEENDGWKEKKRKKTTKKKKKEGGEVAIRVPGGLAQACLSVPLPYNRGIRIMVWVRGRQDGPRVRGTRGKRSEGRTRIEEPAAAASREGSFGRPAPPRREERADARPIERNFRWLRLLAVWQSFSFYLPLFVEPWFLTLRCNVSLKM